MPLLDTTTLKPGTVGQIGSCAGIDMGSEVIINEGTAVADGDVINKGDVKALVTVGTTLPSGTGQLVRFIDASGTLGPSNISNPPSPFEPNTTTIPSPFVDNSLSAQPNPGSSAEFSIAWEQSTNQVIIKNIILSGGGDDINVTISNHGVKNGLEYNFPSPATFATISNHEFAISAGGFAYLSPAGALDTAFDILVPSDQISPKTFITFRFAGTPSVLHFLWLSLYRTSDFIYAFINWNENN